MIAVLCDIRSIHNVGSMFRTADGAGIGKIYLCGITPTPLDRFGNVRSQFAKVALGAERSVAWEHAASAPALLKRLKKEGYLVFAVEQTKRSVPHRTVRLGNGDLEKLAIVLGNEVAGLSPAVLALADKVLEIPMRGEKESLNVSVAFGIVAYHLKE